MAAAATATSLEKASLADVLAQLDVTPNAGLTASEAKARLARYGPNALPEKHVSPWRKVLGYLTGPIAFMIEAAAIVSAILGHWDDFAIIASLLVFNAALGFWQDSKAANALAALKAGLAPTAMVLRDGSWQTADAATLVPGDIVRVRLGNIVPADLRFMGEGFASIDQSALTGESVPVTKHGGDPAYSGSTVKQGEMTGVVIATGSSTFFGRTAKLVAGAGAVSHAQRAMFQIGNFLIVVAVVLAVVLVVGEAWRQVNSGGWRWRDALAILQFVLVLLVASIPVAMPAVFSVTMALGALALSKKKAIVSRLESIEEMAGVDILCTDKTGTLTKNALELGTPVLIGANDAGAVILAAALASHAKDGDPIDTAVTNAAPGGTPGYSVVDYTPFDPVSKRSMATVTDPQGRTVKVAKGAPSAIVELTKVDSDTASRVTKIVAQLASTGNRALGVARSDDNGATWTVLGVLPMFDPPRDDSKATIQAVVAHGVAVKMVTGDDTAIAVETARRLGMGTNIIAAADVFPEGMDPDHVPAPIAATIARADGFARVFPEHKYAIVKTLQQQGHLVAMTGDGVNDAPALKQADCGTAVSGATEAARGAAALILTAPGLSVINNAIDEARRIFGRITSYTLYRVALTIDLMFLVVIASIMLGFQPLTAAMIVVISLLDDIPIMTIAYDRTEVSAKPIRWRMPQILGTSAALGFFAVVQSLGMLLFAYWAMQYGEFGIHERGHLQTVMFLQLVNGGHLLILVTRARRWFFLPPFPAAPLAIAIVGTQLLAVLMSGFGWLVPAIPWSTVGVVLLYNGVWVFIMSAVRITVERLASHGTALALLHRRLISADVRGPQAGDPIADIRGEEPHGRPRPVFWN
ncbi:MAG: plasma-membrane proton-efflux P-type ATPase [Mycobacterium sp.]|nr:plasma-membrane proton-efflux P-type ATPase [Mycobacterium sp.]